MHYLRSQDMKAAQVSINWWMDKEDVVYIHNGILFSHKKEWNVANCNNVEGAREYNAKWGEGGGGMGAVGDGNWKEYIYHDECW